MPQRENEFEYAGNKYSIGTMDLFTQIDIAAKLTPLVTPFLELAKMDGDLKLISEGADLGASRDKILDAVFGKVERFSVLLSKMPNEDRHFIVRECLACVSRKPEGAVGWQKIWNADVSRMQYEDLATLPAAITICAHVIINKLAGFFYSALPNSVPSRH